MNGNEPLREFQHAHVSRAAFSADENRVLTRGGDRTARLWDVNLDLLVRTFRHDETVKGARFNPDQTRVLTWSLDNTARLWDTEPDKRPISLQELEHQIRTGTRLDEFGRTRVLAFNEWRELVQERRKREADEENKRQAPKTSDWGPGERGVQMRVTAPVEVEQGMPMEVTLELQSDPEELPAGVREFNTFLRDRHLELLLRDPETGKTWTVKPYDPTSGLPPSRDEGKSVVPLDRASPQKWTARYPMAEVYETLPPDTYQARVRFSSPEDGTTGPRQWYGSVVSGPPPLKIAPATPKTETLLLPKRLRLSRTLAQLRESDPEQTAIPAITFTKEDAQEVTVLAPNGHFVGTWIYFTTAPLTKTTLDGSCTQDALRRCRIRQRSLGASVATLTRHRQ